MLSTFSRTVPSSVYEAWILLCFFCQLHHVAFRPETSEMILGRGVPEPSWTEMIFDRDDPELLAETTRLSDPLSPTGSVELEARTKMRYR